MEKLIIRINVILPAPNNKHSKKYHYTDNADPTGRLSYTSFFLHSLKTTIHKINGRSHSRITQYMLNSENKTFFRERERERDRTAQAKA